MPAGQNLDAGHGTAEDDPSAQNNPRVHCVQLSREVAPNSVLSVPRGHGVGVAAAARQ
jgi:hypothetical protein